MLTLVDEAAVLEIARLAMARIPDDVVDHLDISDDEFLRLRKAIQLELGVVI